MINKAVGSGGSGAGCGRASSVHAPVLIIVGSIGMPCSGKSMIAKIAKESFSFNVYSFRSVVEEKLESAGFTAATPLDMTLSATRLRERFGPDVFAKTIVERVKECIATAAQKRIFVEGIRTASEIACLKNAFPKIVIIGIVASSNTRIQRALARKRWDDPRSKDEILKKDAQEAAWGVDDGLAAADFVIDNEESLAGFRKKVKRVLERIVDEAQEGGG